MAGLTLTPTVGGANERRRLRSRSAENPSTHIIWLKTGGYNHRIWVDDKTCQLYKDGDQGPTFPEFHLAKFWEAREKIRRQGLDLGSDRV